MYVCMYIYCLLCWNFYNVYIETPYVQALGSTVILATVGSRPVIEFTVAIDSNGLQEFQNNIMDLLNFTFLPNSSRRQIQTLSLVMDPDNFQRYSYTLPPVGINTEGTYTLTINGSDYQ